MHQGIFFFIWMIAFDLSGVKGDNAATGLGIT
jgi:hypothetical protein